MTMKLVQGLGRMGLVGKEAGSALASTSVNVWRGEQEKGNAWDW